MIADPSGIHRLDDLRNFVRQAICERNGLEAVVTPMTERTLLRGSNPCGILFCAHGPRSVQFTAIWDQTKNTVLFYDSAGERQDRAKLSFVPN